MSSTELKAMLMGGVVVLVLIGGGVGLWSMTVAPPPPAIQEARTEERDARTNVRFHMRSFIDHFQRTRKALATGDLERAGAHLLVMHEMSEDLEQGRLEHRIPPEQLKELRVSLEKTRSSLETSAASVPGQLDAIQAACLHCHGLQEGPPPSIFTPHN